MYSFRKTNSSESSSYKAEISQYAQKTQSISGNSPFAGHKISWTSLGDTRWEQFKNYIFSFVSPTYAKAVQEAFWDEIKTDMNVWAASYQVNKKKSTDEITPFVNSLGQAQKEIMESPDLTEAQKMELILKSTGTSTEEIMGETVIAGTTAKEDTERLMNLLRSAGFKYADTATQYFEGKKANVLLLLSLVTIKATVTGDIYSRFQQEKISSVEDLKILTAKVIQAIAKECEDDLSKFSKLETNVSKLLDSIPLSNEDKNALIWLARGPRLKLESKNAIDEMAKHTKKIDKIDIEKKAVEIEVKSESDLAQFQETYLKEVIQTIIKQCGSNAPNLAKLKHNVNELLTYNPLINIPMEGKEQLFNLFKAPMAYAENIKIMHDSLLIEDLSSEKQADILNQVNTYINQSPTSMDDANKLRFDYLLALVKVINKPGNTPAAIVIAKKNFNKLIADPRLNFSEIQKIEIKKELIIGNPDEENRNAEMKALLKSINERKDISLESKMELILLAIGDNAEFKELCLENSAKRYFIEANYFFIEKRMRAKSTPKEIPIDSKMKLINKNALYEILIYLNLFFYNRLDSKNGALTPVARSVYEEINKNNDVQNFRISPKEHEISSPEAVRATRMNLTKTIFTKIMTTASNRTATANVLKDYLQKLTKDIENSDYPLTTQEISELEATIDQLTQGSV